MWQPAKPHFKMALRASAKWPVGTPALHERRCFGVGVLRRRRVRVTSTVWAFNRKAESVAQKITHAKAFKKGLHQQMLLCEPCRLNFDATPTNVLP